MKERPVLLVHGILGQRHVYWNIFRHRLRADGFRVHEVILPYGMLGDMRIAARFLADKVEACLRHDETKNVDIVCHSAGGLVARYYIKYLGGNKTVQNLVTMGTPHAGTYFAYTMPMPIVAIARQTRPGSHFLAELAGPGAVDPHVNYTNLWSVLDAVVIPPEHGVLPGANNIKIPFATHWGFLVRKDIYNQVRRALQSAGNQTLELDGDE